MSIGRRSRIDGQFGENDEIELLGGNGFVIGSLDDGRAKKSGGRSGDGSRCRVEGESVRQLAGSNGPGKRAGIPLSRQHRAERHSLNALDVRVGGDGNSFGHDWRWRWWRNSRAAASTSGEKYERSKCRQSVQPEFHERTPVTTGDNGSRKRNGAHGISSRTSPSSY